MNRRLIRHKKALGAQAQSHVLYWMQSAQRTDFNPALGFALEEARKHGLGILVCFVLSDEIPEARARHYRFMLEGIAEIAQDLKERGIRFELLMGNMHRIVSDLACSAHSLIMDSGYLAWQRQVRDSLFVEPSLDEVEIFEIDTEPLIPVHIASAKEEYSAATLRRKIIALLPEWLDDEELNPKRLPAPVLDITQHRVYKQEEGDFDALWAWACEGLDLDPKQQTTSDHIGGYSEAKKKLRDFLDNKLWGYSEFRSHPGKDFQSELSPYLHFGQISSLEILCRMLEKVDLAPSLLGEMIMTRKNNDGIIRSVGDFAEELIVRRELSMNFCHYNPNYDDFSCLPAWAAKSLKEHSSDPREGTYTLSRLEASETDDPYWNAANRHMIISGKMHNYMRMYWGKRLIAWCKNPEDAYEILLYLNNKYELDGRDPNAYAGIAWCFGKHDRPWQSRPIYGSVRYMNSNGLRRKFDMQAYLDKLEG